MADEDFFGCTMEYLEITIDYYPSTLPRMVARLPLHPTNNQDIERRRFQKETLSRMGMTVSYRRLSPEMFAHLCKDADAATTFFGGDLDDEDDDAWDEWLMARDAEGSYLDIGKAWYGLHVLLTGNFDLAMLESVPIPLRNVVMGGTETEWESGYGLVRYLNPEEVSAVAHLLEQVDAEELRLRFDASAFQAADIYPGGELWVKEINVMLDWLLEAFRDVKSFYSEASKSGSVVLLSLN